MSNDIPRDVPFTISCYECSGNEPESYEEALREGWTEIRYFPEGVAENFLGLCPECRRFGEEQDVARRRRHNHPDQLEGEQ